MRVMSLVVMGAVLGTMVDAAVAQTAVSPPAAGGAQVDALPALRERAQQIVDLINGAGDPAEILHASFLAEHPPEEVRLRAARLRAGLGDAMQITDFVAQSRYLATAVIVFAQVRLPVEISVEREAPHRVNGLMFGE